MEAFGKLDWKNKEKYLEIENIKIYNGVCYLVFNLQGDLRKNNTEIYQLIQDGKSFSAGPEHS